jgi:hypothetical protein
MVEGGILAGTSMGWKRIQSTVYTFLFSSQGYNMGDKERPYSNLKVI